MIGDCVSDFEDWAITALEFFVDDVSWDTTRGLILEWYGGRVDKLEGTEDIWYQGWEAIAHQSGYHDSKDEQGEGTGQEFSSGNSGRSGGPWYEDEPGGGWE